MGLIRRQALEDVGRWDEWCITEDAELSLRVLRAGWSGVHVDASFGHGVMPLTFEALKGQRFRWCFGGIQILRMHWRSLLPGPRGRRNRLTLGQRWAYLSGGLQWYGDLVGLLFFLFLLGGATNLALGGGLLFRKLSPFLLGVIPLLVLPIIAFASAPANSIAAQRAALPDQLAARRRLESRRALAVRGSTAAATVGIAAASTVVLALIAPGGEDVRPPSLVRPEHTRSVPSGQTPTDAPTRSPGDSGSPTTQPSSPTTGPGSTPSPTASPSGSSSASPSSSPSARTTRTPHASPSASPSASPTPTAPAPTTSPSPAASSTPRPRRPRRPDRRQGARWKMSELCVSGGESKRSQASRACDLLCRTPSGTRTPNPLIKSQLLCQLS